MADDKRVAERMLEELLMTLGEDRRQLKACRNKWNAAGVARCERLLKIDYALIRSYCAEHDLELPHDVPPEDAADTE